jgi:hypothetical protein
MRNASIVALAAAVLSGCSSTQYPQTREEFRQSLVSSDTRFKFVDTYVVKRRFEDVVTSLKQNVPQCFNQDVTTTRTQDGMTTMNQTDEWRTTVKVIDRNRAEVTTQQIMKGAIVPVKVPPGGFYVNAVDIERLTPSTTKLSFYGTTSSGSKERWDLIRQWSDGKSTPCPK